jgi:hypothetical protein
MKELKNINKIFSEATERSSQRLLFDFGFGETVLKCLLLVPNRVLMLSIKNLSIGHSIAINENGEIDTFLPSEFHSAIRNDLIKEYKEDSTNKLFEAFDEYLPTLDINKISEATDNDIINIIGTIRTNDKKYDDEGEKPYFESWVRHIENEFTKTNLNKTAKYFGKDIAKLCEQQNVSSRWKETPQEKSLDLLDLKKARDGIMKVRQ